MTTPAGVPNLPIGALTVETLGQKLQDQTAAAMRNRAGEQMPSIFGLSTGGDILSDLSPFGILTNIWAGINSLIANSDPNDIQGPEDLPPLFLEFIENLPVIGQFVQLLEALAGNYTGDDVSLQGIQELLAPIRAFIDTVGQGIADLLAWIWDNFGAQVDTFLKPIIEFFSWLWQGAPGGFGGLGAQVESLLKPLTEWLTWLWTEFGTGDFLQPLFTTLKTVWDIFAAAATGLGETAGSLIEGLFGFLSWLWNGIAGGFAGFSGTVDTILKPIIEWLTWLWSQFGSTVDTVLKPIFQWLNWLFGTLFAGSTAALTNIFTALHGLLDGSGTLTTWLSGLTTLSQELIDTVWSLLNGGATAINKTINDVITSVGVFVQNLVPALTGVPGALGIGEIAGWASNLLSRALTWPDFKTIFGEIPADILGVLPVSNINLINPELMAQGGFDSSATLAAGNGWAWDSTTTHSGSGGSAKVSGAGTARNLWSNQSISVTQNDQLIISCWVKSSGTVASGAIQLKIVEFNGTTQGTTRIIATSGVSSSWVQIGNSAGAPYTVGSGVTSIRIGVGITSAAASGSTIWFDDISARKTGLLSGDWMAGIVGTVVQDFQSIVDKIIQAIKGATAGGTGNALGGIFTAINSIFSTLFNRDALPTNLTSNPLLPNAIPGLHANKITEGTFSSDFIGENAVGTYQIAPDAVGTSEIAPDAVGTSEISTGAVTGGATGELAQNTITSNNVTEIDGTKIKSGTINVDRLPSTLTAVGSGFHITKNVNAAAYTTVLNGSGTSGTVNFMPYSFYDLTSSQIAGSTITPDITINNVSGNLCATISNAGWYLVQVSFVLVGGIYPGQFNYRWGFTPGIVKSTVSSLPAANFFRAGPTAVPTVDYNVNASSSWAPDVAHGSWVVYLNANESLYPSYYCTREGSGMFTDTIIKNGVTGVGGANLTSFSIALLNRSLA